MRKNEIYVELYTWSFISQYLITRISQLYIRGVLQLYGFALLFVVPAKKVEVGVQQSVNHQHYLGKVEHTIQHPGLGEVSVGVHHVQHLVLILVLVVYLPNLHIRLN